MIPPTRKPSENDEAWNARMAKWIAQAAVRQQKYDAKTENRRERRRENQKRKRIEKKLGSGPVW